VWTLRDGPEGRPGSTLPSRTEAIVGRRRHSDLDLLELAREGSAPAFASLLHRHREVLRRGALRAEHPAQVVESAMVAATRRLRRGEVPEGDLHAWLSTVVEEQVQGDPGRPGVERMLPTDWFDRGWVGAERYWPSGRRLPRPPRWVLQAAGALLLAGAGALGTYVTITSEASTEVVHELIAEPVEDPDVVAVPGPLFEAPREEAPELFGDVEIGELPTYDLTGEAGRNGPGGPTVAPRPEDDRSAGTDTDGGVGDGIPDDAEDRDDAGHPEGSPDS